MFSRHSRNAFRIALVGATLPASLAAQSTTLGPTAPTTLAPSHQSDVLARVNGTVVDLHRGARGVLAVTSEGKVLEIDPTAPPGARKRTIDPGPFPEPLRAVTRTPAGDVLVIDANGDISSFAGGTGPRTLLYDDLWLIGSATDLIADEDGNLFVACHTPSSGVRATNRISADGSLWSYYVVDESPLQLAADPLTDDVFMADVASGGALRVIDGTLPTHPVTPLDTTTKPGFSAANDDGDLAVDQYGNVYMIAGGKVWYYNRYTQQTTLFAGGYGQLRGATIAPSTHLEGDDSRWSLYLAQGANPTVIRQIRHVGKPGGQIARNPGEVPGKGDNLFFAPAAGMGQEIWALAIDNDDDILVGGNLWHSSPKVYRYHRTTGAISLVANAGDGLADEVTGLAVAPDDTIYVLTEDGRIQSITENPVVVTTVYDDASNTVVFGCDLALDVDGSFYVADRESWGNGKVVHVAGGLTSVLSNLSPGREARGLSADPLGGGMFVSEWGNGFDGRVSRYDFGTTAVTPVPSFDLINYSNGYADADTVVDVAGRIYTVSEDDWSLVRYDPVAGDVERIGSGYTRRLSGVELGLSTPGSGSTTGWSLYVTDYDDLWEIPSMLGPAGRRVDSTAPRQASLIGSIHPSHGEPRALAASRTPGLDGVFVSTSTAELLHVDVEDGAVTRVAGAEHGLDGDLVELRVRRDGGIRLLNAAGRAFGVDPAHGFRVHLRPDRPGRPRARRAPSRVAGFDAGGNAYVVAPSLGRILRAGRAGGRLDTLSGGHGDLKAVTLVRGTRFAGGEVRTRLVALDGWHLFELEVPRRRASRWTG